MNVQVKVHENESPHLKSISTHFVELQKRTWYFTFSLQMDFYCQPAHKTNGKRLYSQCETKRRRTLKNNFILEQKGRKNPS